MAEGPVVTCFLRNRGEVLLLRSAPDSGTSPGRWTAVTGAVGDGEPGAAARRAVRAETGRSGDEVVRAGDPFEAHDEASGRSRLVHPFLLEAADRSVETTDAVAAAEWTPATAILRREAVPDLWRAYAAVAPTPGTVADDREHGSAMLSLRALESLRDAAGLAHESGHGVGPVAERTAALLAARPSMAAVGNRVNRAMADTRDPAAVEAAAIEGIRLALDADGEAAERAAENLAGASVLTLSRSGTVLDALRMGAEAAIVAESRPAREGVGVAESLAEAGLEVTVCTDAAMAHAVAVRAVDAVVVGADAVLSDGRLVNKTGTRLAALAAREGGVPCFVVAASDKVRGDDAAHLEDGDPAAVYDGGAAVEAWNPTFDVTPAHLVTGVVTERGVLDAEGVADVAAEHRELARWRDATGQQ